MQVEFFVGKHLYVNKIRKINIFIIIAIFYETKKRESNFVFAIFQLFV